MSGRRHPNDWERQREQLSAYIDGELSAAERADLERHIPGCAECQTALGELRQVHDLLAALPLPNAPRSFALPLVTLRDARPQGPSLAPRRPAPRGKGAGLTQWAGALAATIGLFLLLGGAVMGLLGTHSNQYAAGNGSGDATLTGAQSQSSASATPGLRTPDLATTRNPETKDGLTPTVPASPTPGNNNFSTTAARDEPGFPILPVGGAGLVALGAGLYVVGRLRRSRAESGA